MASQLSGLAGILSTTTGRSSSGPEQLVTRAAELKHSGQHNARPNQSGYRRIETRAMRDHDEDASGDRCEREVDVTQVVEIRQPDGCVRLLPWRERSRHAPITARGEQAYHNRKPADHWPRAVQ
jgi:hypothetical protein